MVLLLVLLLLLARVVSAGECLLLRNPAENSTAFVMVEFADEDNNPMSPAEATRTVFDANGVVLDGPVTVISPGASFNFTVPWNQNVRGQMRVVQTSWKWGLGNQYQNVLRCQYEVLPAP